MQRPARPADQGAGWDAPYRGARVVVLGAAGFIGRWVARALSARGAELYLVVRDAVGAATIFSRYGARGEIVEVDLRDAEQTARVLRDVRPASVFNLAGYGVDRSERDEQTAQLLNTTLVRVVCDALARLPIGAWPGQAIVHAGSALEYGAIGGNLDEAAEPRPTTLYGRTKLAGTEQLRQACATAQVRGLTARLFTVYGPGEHAGRLLPALLATARTGDPLALTAGQQVRDFTYVEDVAEGLLRLGLARAESGQTVNLATGRLTSVRSFAETAAEILGLPATRLGFGALPQRPEESELQHAPVALARLRRLIGWVPPTEIGAGIRRTVELQEPDDGSSG